MPHSNKCGAGPADQRAAPRGVRGRELEPGDHALLSLSESGLRPARGSTIFLSNVELPHVINFRASFVANLVTLPFKFVANLVTLPFKFGGKETSEVHHAEALFSVS